MRALKVNGLLASLVPQRCFFCHRPSKSRPICPGCNADLPWIQCACKLCGAPLPAGFPARTCTVCPISMPGIDRIRSALIYEYPVDRLVVMTKYRDRLDGAQLLGDLLETYLLARKSEDGLDEPDLILPVPLHRFRLAYRGFNQALEIAAPVATGLGIPMRADLCRRTRHTREQATLTGRARYQNTHGAFAVAEPLQDKHIAIVDDVVTTGSTVAAMAATLRVAGASKIQVWSVARTHRKTNRGSLKSVVEQNTGK